MNKILDTSLFRVMKFKKMLFLFNRQALNEAKKQNHNLLERVQSAQNDLNDADVRSAELDGQVRTSHTVSYITIHFDGLLCYRIIAEQVIQKIQLNPFYTSDS